MIAQEMNLEIEHRAGKENTNADAVPRNPVDDTRIAQFEVSDSSPLQDFLKMVRLPLNRWQTQTFK